VLQHKAAVSTVIIRNTRRPNVARRQRHLPFPIEKLSPIPLDHAASPMVRQVAIPGMTATLDAQTAQTGIVKWSKWHADPAPDQIAANARLKAGPLDSLQ